MVVTKLCICRWMGGSYVAICAVLLLLILLLFVVARWMEIEWNGVFGGGSADGGYLRRCYYCCTASDADGRCVRMNDGRLRTLHTVAMVVRVVVGTMSLVLMTILHNTWETLRRCS